MAEVRTYPIANDFNLSTLAKSTEHFLDVEQHLTVQTFEMDNRIVIQALKDDADWKKFLGLDASLTVEMKVEDGLLSITIGNAKWYDKGTVAAVGAIFFTPLLLTAGYGALRQSALPQMTFEQIEGQLSGRIQ